MDRYVVSRYDSEAQIENFLYLFPKGMVPCGAAEATEVPAASLPPEVITALAIPHPRLGP